MTPWRLIEAGLNDAQRSRLVDEAKEFADRRVQSEAPRSEDNAALERLVSQKVNLIYPQPTNLPPAPQPLDNSWLGSLLPVALFGGLILGALSANNKSIGGFAGALGTVWGGFILLWIVTGAFVRQRDRAIDEYWRTYDPHRKHRSNLSEGLSSVASSALSTARVEYSRPLATVPPQEVVEHPRQGLPWKPRGERPRPMTYCDDRDAEDLAMRWMKYLGATGCRVSQATRDGGADVFSDHFVAEVKHHASPVPPALVRQINGVAHEDDRRKRRPLFFTLTGYSDASVEFANRAKVALFVYDYRAGTLVARSKYAEEALERGLPSLIERV